MKSAVPKKSDAKTGNKPGAKPAVKTERLAAPARRTRKAAASPTKGRKGAAAAAQPVPSAGAAASVLPTHGRAAASPGSYISDGSGLDDSAGGVALTAADSLPASSPVFSFGSSPHSRAPTTGYSGVFGTGLHHQSSSGRGQGSQATAEERSVGDPFGWTPAAAQLRGGESTPNIQQAAQVPAWIGVGSKRAMGYGEWRRGVSSSQSSPLQQQLSDARSDSPTTATLDSFNLKLSLESPTRESATLPPPPPSPHGHPYMLHHQFPHHQQACFNHINWAGGRYPGQTKQPLGFPVELMSPVGARFPVQQHGSGSRDFHAFSKVDDTSEADASNNPACSADDAAEACDSGEGATGTAAAAATVSEDPAPRRTGFMSYLLHQRPQSPPFDSCPSPPAPPTAPSTVDVLDVDL